MFFFLSHIILVFNWSICSTADSPTPATGGDELASPSEVNETQNALPSEEGELGMSALLDHGLYS